MPQANGNSGISSIWVNQMFPLRPEDEIRLCCLDRVFGNIQPYELFALVTIEKSVAAKSVFEIGTFDGRTARNLAGNLAPAGILHTLDLPASTPAGQTAFKIDDREQRLVLGDHVGRRYKGTPEAQNIKQLAGDSATFDFSPYAGAADLVFVDGSHVYDYVRSDSETAMRLVRPGTGVIVWHDYGPEFPDVRTYLNRFAEEPGDWKLYHLLHTLMVVGIPARHPLAVRFLAEHSK